MQIYKETNYIVKRWRLRLHTNDIVSLDRVYELKKYLFQVEPYK